MEREASTSGIRRVTDDLKRLKDELKMAIPTLPQST